MSEPNEHDVTSMRISLDLAATMDSENAIFDCGRIAFCGFEQFVHA